MSGVTVDIKSESELKSEELPASATLPGVDEILAKKLKTAGFVSLNDIASARAEDLAQVEGIDPDKAKELIESARLTIVP